MGGKGDEAVSGPVHMGGICIRAQASVGIARRYSRYFDDLTKRLAIARVGMWLFGNWNGENLDENISRVECVGGGVERFGSERGGGGEIYLEKSEGKTAAKIWARASQLLTWDREDRL